VKYLINGGESNIFNLGNGVGFTVKEVIETERKVTGLPIKAVEEKRRAGVLDILIASSDKAKEVLGWKPELNSLEDIISTAWKWHSTHPNGYAE
jgi:UDP-glucose 4-epimerase